MPNVENKLDDLQALITETGKWVSYDYASPTPTPDHFYEDKYIYVGTSLIYRLNSKMQEGYLTQKFHGIQNIYIKKSIEKEPAILHDFSNANKVNIMSKLTFCKELPDYLLEFSGKTLLPEIIMREGVMVRDEWKGLTLVDWKYIGQIENF